MADYSPVYQFCGTSSLDSLFSDMPCLCLYAASHVTFVFVICRLLLILLLLAQILFEWVYLCMCIYACMIIYAYMYACMDLYGFLYSLPTNNTVRRAHHT